MILLNWLRRYRANSPLASFHPASWNRICNVLEGIEGIGCQIFKTESGHGWQVIVDGVSSDIDLESVRKNFSVKVGSGNSCNVQGGKVFFNGVGFASVSTDDIALGALDVWVYVWVDRASLSARIDQAWELPLSDAKVLRLPLVHLVADSSEDTWEVTETCHDGDFHFDAPLR
jgi:hypothetical protein